MREREAATTHLHDSLLDKVLDADAVRVARLGLVVVGEKAEEEGRLERKVLRLAVGDERDEGREEVAAEEEGAERALVDRRDDDEGELEGAVADGDCEAKKGVKVELSGRRPESEDARGT